MIPSSLSADSSPVSSSSRLARRLFFSLAAFYVLFIMTVSWIPGATTSVQQDFLFHLRRILSFQTLPGHHDLRDVTTNVLLYIPFGIFVGLAVSTAGPRFFSSWIASGFLVSVLVETFQASVSRFPDSMDLITNTAGFLFGYWVIWGAVQYFRFQPAALVGLSISDQENERIKTLAAIRFLYVSIYFLVALLPFDFSFDPAEISQKMMADRHGLLRIIVDPCYHFYFWKRDGVIVVFQWLGLLPVAFLTALRADLEKRLMILKPVLVCGTIAMVGEVAKVFVMSQTSDILAVGMSVCAGISGWGIVKLLRRIHPDPVQQDRQNPVVIRPWVFFMAGIYGFFLLFISLVPFHFENSWRMVWYKMVYQTNWVPLREHFLHRSLGGAMDLVLRTAVFLPLGYLVEIINNLFVNRRSSGQRSLIILAIAGIMALIMEILRVFCVGRYFDVSGLALGMAGALIGSWLFRIYSDSPRAE